MTGNILDAIGNTPCVELRRIVPPGSARILVKLEGANPTGNMKDRMARHAIAAAAADGRLRAGGTLVEYTGGSTGASLALVCAARGYRARIVTSDAFSAEKTATMRALGAEITLVPSDGGRITAELVHAMIAQAKEISAEPGHWWFDQLNNKDSAAGYHGLGDEIWSQSSGGVDAFVTSVGTAHSLNGTAAALRRHNTRLHVIAAEPAEFPVLSGGAKVPTASRASASASSRRTGSPNSWTSSKPPPARKRCRCAAASPARKASWPAPPPASTSSRRCVSPGASDRTPPSRRSRSI